jgi:hypothetical protein
VAFVSPAPAMGCDACSHEQRHSFTLTAVLRTNYCITLPITLTWKLIMESSLLLLLIHDMYNIFPDCTSQVISHSLDTTTYVSLSFQLATAIVNHSRPNAVPSCICDHHPVAPHNVTRLHFNTTFYSHLWYRAKFWRNVELYWKHDSNAMQVVGHTQMTYRSLCTRTSSFFAVSYNTKPC